MAGIEPGRPAAPFPNDTAVVIEAAAQVALQGIANMGQEALSCLTDPALASCLETVANIATALATDGEGAALTDITESTAAEEAVSASNATRVGRWMSQAQLLVCSK